MDTYCSRCGEPWDIDYLRREIDDHDPGFVFGANRLVVLRCTCCDQRPEIPQSKEIRAIAEELGYLLGDDLDGFATEMEELVGTFGGMEKRKHGKQNQ